MEQGHRTDEASIRGSNLHSQQSLGGGLLKCRGVWSDRPPDIASTSNNSPLDTQASWLGGHTKADLVRMQQEDPDISKRTKWKEAATFKRSRDIVAAESPCTRHLWLLWDQLKLVDGILCKTCNTTASNMHLQLVGPRDLYKTILEAMHNPPMSGHLGVKKTYSRLQQKYYWYRMKDSVQEWIRTCTKCGARKRPVHTPRAPLADYHVGAPLDRVAMDMLGPFPVSNNGNRYVLVVGGVFFKWIEDYGIPDFSAAMWLIR